MFKLFVLFSGIIAVFSQSFMEFQHMTLIQSDLNNYFNSMLYINNYYDETENTTEQDMFDQTDEEEDVEDENVDVEEDDIYLE